MRPRGALLLALCVAAASCSDGGVGPGAPPRAVVVEVIADGPLVRTATASLDAPGALTVEYWSEDTPRLRVRSARVATRHTVLLGRLRAGRTYQYEVWPESPGGASGSPASASFTTGPLPESLLRVAMTTVGEPTSPMVMLEALGEAGRFGFPFVVDGEGHIVWYRESEPGSTGFTRLENGDFVFNASGGLWVVDAANRLVARLDLDAAADETGIAPFTIHHDVIATPRNSVLMLVQDTALVDETVWTGEAIWEWDPATGDLSKRWTAKDFFDPRVDRGARSVPDDWLHANSLHIRPRGNVIVSFFWLHEVISIAPDFQSIEWRLGGPASDFLVSDAAMEAGQHTAAEVSPDRILMFDNGRDRSAGLYSRALEVQIDRASGRTDVVWQFRPTPDIYAPIISSARRLPSGNTLVGFGMSAGSFEDATGPLAVFEATPDGSVHWRLDVVDGLDFVYRATPVWTIAGEVAVNGRDVAKRRQGGG